MVGCVVLNWNRWQDTLTCLQTLAAQTYTDLWVIVVDNGSTDGSIERIEAFAAEQTGPVRFTFVPNGANVGFARGSNVGVRIALDAGCEFVWLLNNDVECPPDTLQKLVRTAKQRPDAGMVGTVLFYHHDPSRVQAWSGGRINRWTGTSSHYLSPTPQGRDSYVTFASALIRAAVLQQIGLLYEGAFMYYEDSDFGVRMQATPWRIAVAEDTAVLHKEGASTEGTRNPRIEQAITVAGLKFLSRHSPFPPLSLPLLLGIKLANRARKGEWAAMAAVLRGAKEFWQGDRKADTAKSAR
jgi:GT2 family glycosyltransferase